MGNVEIERRLRPNPWLRCLGLALVLGFAIGCGQYALAPGGAYVDYTMQGISHDWHRYLWFFQIPLRWQVVILFHALFASGFLFIELAVIAVGAAAVMTFLLPSLGAKFVAVKSHLLWPLAAVLGILVGLLVTVLDGRNPGII